MATALRDQLSNPRRLRVDRDGIASPAEPANRYRIVPPIPRASLLRTVEVVGSRWMTWIIWIIR